MWYSNWACEGYKIRMEQDNLNYARHYLSFKNDKIRKNIRKNNIKTINKDEKQRLNIPKNSIAGDFNATFPVKQNRSHFTRKFFFHNKAYGRVQNSTITVVEKPVLLSTMHINPTLMNEVIFNFICIFILLVYQILCIRVKKYIKRIYRKKKRLFIKGA